MDSTVSKYCMYLSPYVGFIVLKNQYGWLPSVGRMGQQCVVAEEGEAHKQTYNWEIIWVRCSCMVLASFPGAEEGPGTRRVWYYTGTTPTP